MGNQKKNPYWLGNYLRITERIVLFNVEYKCISNCLVSFFNGISILEGYSRQNTSLYKDGNRSIMEVIDFYR